MNWSRGGAPTTVRTTTSRPARHAPKPVPHRPAQGPPARRHEDGRRPAHEGGSEQHPPAQRSGRPRTVNHSAQLERLLVLGTDLLLLSALLLGATSLTLTAVTSAVSVLAWHARGLYAHRIALSVLDDVPPLAVGVLVGLAPGVAAALLVPTGTVGGTAALRVACTVLAAAVVSRVFSYHLILWLRRKGLVSYPTVLIGAGPAASSLAERIVTHPESGLQIVGLVSNDGGKPADLPLLGGSADLSTVVRNREISNIVIGYGGISAAELIDVLRTGHQDNLEIHVVPRLFELSTRRGSDDHIWGLPLVRLRAPANRRLAWRAKRAFDVVGSLLLLLAASPVMAAMVVLVRVHLGPGVIFTQTRIGRHGEPFGLMKFRSMPHAPDNGTRWSVPAEELGRFGRFVRRYSLDELPQLVNVLRGDMSLVGPRPERPEYVDKFVALFPWYTHRHRVAVGMTGLAAVNGLRGDTSIEERCKFDNWYIDNWSLWLDVKILVRTLSAVTRGTGA